MQQTQEERNVHNQKILDYLNLDRKRSKQFCNRTLCSQGENFAINDGIVASMSGYFEKMFSAELREKYAGLVNLDKIPPKRLESVLDYIYTGGIKITEENVLEVLEDADYMQIEDLKTFCRKFMLNNISTNNCLKLRAYATRYNLADVEKKTNQMIVDNIATVVQHDDFMQLDVLDMSAIIKHRGKNCEEVVFSGIVKWVNSNPHQREELFVNLFSQLDLSSMTSDFLQQVSTENLVKKNLECLNKLVTILMGKLLPAELLVIGGINSDSDCVVYDVKAMKSKNLAELNPGRWCLTSTRCGRKVYVMGGEVFLVIGGKYSREDCIMYDVMKKQSKHMEKLNPGRSCLTSTRCGRKVYVMGGEGGCGRKCQVLDLDENTWSKMPDMLEERKNCRSAYIKDVIYVTGGRSNGSSCEKLDITNKKWERMRNMLHERSYHATVVCNDKLYCIGGWEGDTEGMCLDSCECYDAEVDEWKEIPSLNEVRDEVVCVVLDGYIYAIGGRDNNDKPMSTVERYKPGGNKWEYVASLKTARRGHSACVLQNKIFAIGGKDVNEKNLKSVEVYDPTFDVWTFCFETEKPVFYATVVSI